MMVWGIVVMIWMSLIVVSEYDLLFLLLFFIIVFWLLYSGFLKVFIMVCIDVDKL